MPTGTALAADRALAVRRPSAVLEFMLQSEPRHRSDDGRHDAGVEPSELNGYLRQDGLGGVHDASLRRSCSACTARLRSRARPMRSASTSASSS